MRIEKFGDSTLYLGDCREVLQEIYVHGLVVITDPVWPNCPSGLIPGSADPDALWRAFCGLEVIRSCAGGAAVPVRMMDSYRRLVVVMRHDSDPRFLAPVSMRYTRATILPYAMPGYIGRLLGGDELAYCFGAPIPSKPGQRVIPGRAPIVQPGDRPPNGHPCSRALPHFKFLVRWWSEPEEVVLDPFMGSGTTGLACHDLGRKFIGIEVDPDYFDIACAQFEDAMKRPRLIA